MRIDHSPEQTAYKLTRYLTGDDMLWVLSVLTFVSPSTLSSWSYFYHPHIDRQCTPTIDTVPSFRADNLDEHLINRPDCARSFLRYIRTSRTADFHRIVSVPANVWLSLIAHTHPVLVQGNIENDIIINYDDN